MMQTTMTFGFRLVTILENRIINDDVRSRQVQELLQTVERPKLNYLIATNKVLVNKLQTAL